MFGTVASLYFILTATVEHFHTQYYSYSLVPADIPNLEDTSSLTVSWSCEEQYNIIHIPRFNYPCNARPLEY